MHQYNNTRDLRRFGQLHAGFVVLAMMLIGGVLSAQVPTTNLVAYWPFTGNANDASGNGHHGTTNGGPALVDDRFGNSRRAYAFDGVNDFISIVDHPDFRVPVGTNQTLSLWFKACDSSKLFGDQSLFVRDDNLNGNPSLLSLFIRPANEQIGFWVVHNGFGFNTKVSDGQWHHVVIVISDTIRSPVNNSTRWIGGYIDNQLLFTNVRNGDARTPTIFELSDTTATIFIGRTLPTGGYFKGAIDDIRIYHRNLSAAEVNTLYTENNWPNSAPDSRAIASKCPKFWKFDPRTARKQGEIHLIYANSVPC